MDRLGWYLEEIRRELERAQQREDYWCCYAMRLEERILDLESQLCLLVINELQTG